MNRSAKLTQMIKIYTFKLVSFMINNMTCGMFMDDDLSEIIGSHKSPKMEVNLNELFFT